MSDEFEELYNMLSIDRDDVRKVKSDYEHDLNMLLNRVRGYHVNEMDISSEYDVDGNFNEYRLNEVSLNYNLNNDTLEYKISLLQGYLQELFVEKKFNKYKSEQEQKMSKNEYLEYTHNPSVKSDKISYWYQEFMNK